MLVIRRIVIFSIEFTLDFALGGHSSGADHGGSANSGEKGLREHFRRYITEYLNVEQGDIERKRLMS